VVTVHDVVGLTGGGLAGVLYTGTEMLHANAIGGFGAEIDGDPFSVTSTVNSPYLFAPIFPYVSDEPLLLVPGTYILFIWADQEPLTPYGRWAPAGPSESRRLLGCSTVVEVGRSDVHLSIEGVPAQPLDRPLERCTMD
jgi:hypothetical protein